MNFDLGPAVDAEIRDVRILIYGNSGAGKTFAASTCLSLEADSDDFAVALCTEPNGVLSVKHGAKGTNVLIPSWICKIPERDGNGEIRRDANGRATMIPEIDPATGKPKLRYHAISLGEVREFLGAVKSGELSRNGRRPSVLIVDSLTDIFKMFKDEVHAEKRAKANTDERRTAAEIFSQQDYGTLEQKFSAFMRNLRDLGLKIVATALATEDVDKAQDGTVIGRSYRPGFEGSTTRKIAGYFEVMGYVRRDTRPGANGTFKERRTITWTGPERIACKGAAELTGVTDMLKNRMSDAIEALCGKAQPLNGPLGEDPTDDDALEQPTAQDTDTTNQEPHTEPTPATQEHAEDSNPNTPKPPPRRGPPRPPKP